MYGVCQYWGTVNDVPKFLYVEIHSTSKEKLHYTTHYRYCLQSFQRYQTEENPRKWQSC